MEATFVRDLDDFHGTAKLWRLSEPYAVRDWDDEQKAEVSYVVTSAVSALGVPETYIFPADDDGEVVDWCELPGSFRGDLDHQAAIDGFVAAQVSA